VSEYSCMLNCFSCVGLPISGAMRVRLSVLPHRIAQGLRSCFPKTPMDGRSDSGHTTGAEGHWYSKMQWNHISLHCIGAEYVLPRSTLTLAMTGLVLVLQRERSPHTPGENSRLCACDPMVQACLPTVMAIDEHTMLRVLALQ
jgi:hypothetical protein